MIALDVAGRQILASPTIMTIPGPPSIPTLSVSIEVGGRFSWSPGGDSIAFVDASVLGERSLAVLDTRTLGITHLVTYSNWIRDAIWSRDGAFIAFTHTPTQTAGSIDYRVWTWRMSNAGARTETSGRVDFDPAWGGGEWLYFCRGTYEPPNIPEIWRVKSGDVSSMRAVTADPNVYKYSPSVRPTDDWIVYQGRPRGHLRGGLFTVRPGGTPVSLTEADRYVDSNPFWSPDGHAVVFISNRSGHPEVWSVEVGSGALRQVTRKPRGASALCASWSPDGARLAVLDARETGSSAHGRLEIHEALTALP